MRTTTAKNLYFVVFVALIKFNSSVKENSRDVKTVFNFHKIYHKPCNFHSNSLKSSRSAVRVEKPARMFSAM